jgi:hypothetical protein
MKNLSTLLILALATGVAAAQTTPKAPTTPTTTAMAPPIPTQTCFELSKDGKLWSRTPEQLCIGSGDKAVEIKLQTGMPTATTVASFTLDRTTRAKCIDCNRDVYSISNPQNSVFNQLAITFHGKRDPKAPGTESGTLTIGKTKFFYRKK